MFYRMNRSLMYSLWVCFLAFRVSTIIAQRGKWSCLYNTSSLTHSHIGWSRGVKRDVRCTLLVLSPMYMRHMCSFMRPFYSRSPFRLVPFRPLLMCCWWPYQPVSFLISDSFNRKSRQGLGEQVWSQVFIV